uniref:DNA polymerase n=1 Tax=Mimivirus LCMiAC02 TaxID=2506609 RepID=A0A481Z0Z6_9VIRU|nr:MAG: DNA polymerase family B elongation subunit [Mimivirus LCMiAC02]
MRKNLKSKNLHETTNNKDLIFQILEWDKYEDEIENNDGELVTKFIIRLYGTTDDNKKIYIRVDKFPPYFFVNVPDDWTKHKVLIFVEELKNKVKNNRRFGVGQSESLFEHKIVKKKIFYGFTNYKDYKFVKLSFHSYLGYYAFRTILYWKIYNPILGNRAIIYDMYESNIEPMFRCMHEQNLQASGWVKIPKKKYTLFMDHEKPSQNEINVYTDYENLCPMDGTQSSFDCTKISPLRILAFDIECSSEDGSFPQPQRDNDKVIQIGSTFNTYGNMKCYYKHIITLGTCDPIEGAVVESYETEKEVLLAWPRLIQRMNPDIVTGYNTFGFDYRYLEARSQKLGCNSNFTKLGRILHTRSPFIKKDLSSAALGKNILTYYMMQGRVQIDLLGVMRSSHHKLSSYKLDNVASVFIRDNINDIIIDDENGTSTIMTNNTIGLSTNRYIKIVYNDGLSDNSYKNTKFKVMELTDKSIKINEIVDKKAIGLRTNKVFWCQAKDDVKPHDIFRLQKGSSADRSIVARYCLQDCMLCNILLEKLQVITNSIGMSNVCSIPLSYLFLRGQGVKILSLVSKECRERNHLIKVLKRKRKTKKIILDKNGKKVVKVEENDGYEGATVLRPHPGVHYSPITVLDYKSLYPSSMIHRNISHECLVLDQKYDNLPGVHYYEISFYNKDEDKTKVTRRYAKKYGTIGIIPEILKKLLAARDSIKDKMKNEKNPFKKKIFNGLQLAYKITANSLYGQTGAKTSAIYLRDVAASTTATGREMLNLARLFAEYIYPIIIFPILQGDHQLYRKRAKLLFKKKIDELLGEKTIKKLKSIHYKDNNDPKNFDHLKYPSDYYYLRVFQERTKVLTNKEFINKKLGHKCMMDFLDYFYKEIQELFGDKTFDPFCVYGDTDSVFVDLRIKNKNNEILTNKSALKMAIKLGILCGDLINLLLPYPQKLNYEKTFHPWIQLAKKMYTGYLYEYSPDKFYLKNMGIVLKRRDNATIVKIVIGGIVHKILKYRSGIKAAEFTKQAIKDILHGKYPMDKFIITKTLKGNALTKSERIKEAEKPKEERIYVDRTRQKHVVLADRMADRDPGNKPLSNDRIPFVYKIIENGNRRGILQGDRVEHPDYLIEHNLEIDYLFYITNQIMKPAIQFLDKVIKDPKKKIFDLYIIRELNRRMGKRPVKYYLLKSKSNNNYEKCDLVNSLKYTDNDNVFSFNGFNSFSNYSNNDKENKQKQKRKTKKKKKKKKEVSLVITSEIKNGRLSIY